MKLAKRLFMARVSPSEEVPINKWQTGHYKVMPLPELLGEHYSARFEEMGLVDSATLLTADGPSRGFSCPRIGLAKQLKPYLRRQIYRRNGL